MQPSSNNPWYFTRKERIGILALVTVILILWLWPTVHAMWYKPNTTIIPQPALDSALQAFALPENNNPEYKTSFYQNHYSKNNWSHNNNYYNYKSNNTTINRTLFNFDPNTLSAEGFKQLGLRDKTIRIITNYRSKGGRFKTAEDLQKIYGLSATDFEAIKPYVKITAKADTANHSANAYTKKTSTYSKTPITVDINTADSTSFEKLPGIGPKLSSRIVNYRKKLGGFYSIDQVAETFGIVDSVFQKIKPQLNISNISLQKININTASEEALDAHPYITKTQAKIIVAYRNEHGTFTSIESLKKLAFANDDWLNKISPYLAIN